ncbi:MAG TPA: GAF domain-containing protein [Acidimicrobiales bacterium]|nr:GAF domain-containing protein [Acidimicrobiales bacterium]
MSSKCDSNYEFGVSVVFGGDRANVEVLGVLDGSNAHLLGEFLNAAIASGSDLVALHLEEFDLEDPIGIQIIAEAAHHLVALGGRLTIHAAQTFLARLTTVDEFRDLVEVQAREQDPEHLGIAQSISSAAMTPRVASLHPEEELRRLIAVPSSRDVVDGVLRLLLGIAQVAIGGADGVSVSLRRQGVLATVAASDQTISAMDANQYRTGEGPCVDASVTGRWFHAESLSSESRWPRFTPAALGLGINAILSLPLLSEDHPVGALNIYSRTESAFGSDDQRLATLFAEEASSILSAAGVDLSDTQSSHQIGRSLQIRRTIAQAEGIIMERRGVSADAAYSELRDHSQRTNQPLREFAASVVDSTQLPKIPTEDRSSGGEHESK